MTMARRTRAEIVRANDAAIRAAATSMICDEGWDGLTFTGVAKRAGLTVGAVYGRAENAAELGIDLWQVEIAPWFEAALANVIDQTRAGNQAGLTKALALWDRERVKVSVLVELLIASQFDPDLAEVVGTEATHILTRYCRPGGGSPGVTPHDAASAVLISAFVLGRALAIRAGVSLHPASKQQIGVLCSYYSAPATSRKTPKPQELIWIRPMDDIDPAARAVIEGTLGVLGRVGYRRATIARIARVAGVPRGSVLSNYAHKAALIADAARRGLIPPGEVWAQYGDVIAKHGPLTSRAMFLEDFLKRDNRSLWAVNLELSRTARVQPELAEFGPGESVLERTHLGVMLVAMLVPGLHKLSFLRAFLAGTAT